MPAIERGARVLYGSVILLSIALAHPRCPLYLSEDTLFVATLAAVLMVQAAVTGFCPAELLLRKLGVGRAAGGGATPTA
jgi:hypothetical protein